MRIAIAADHAGLPLKQPLAEALARQGTKSSISAPPITMPATTTPTMSCRWPGLWRTEPLSGGLPFAAVVWAPTSRPIKSAEYGRR